MHFYSYEATDATGNRVRGQVSAETKEKAFEALVGKGYLVTWVHVDEYVVSNKAEQTFAAAYVGLPAYRMVTIGGYGLMVGGCMQAVYGLFAWLGGLSPQSPAGEGRMGFAIMLSGIVLAGMGQVIHCIRDIARNSWRRRV